MSDTPAWFTHAINTRPQSRFVDVDGTPIHYLAWNPQEREKPGLLLAHGFRAHARWWSFIAPFLMDRFRVVALDLSWMGDSGSRNAAEYSFVPDIVGVIEHAGLARATLVGHSFGGARVIRVCAENPQVVERAIVIDTFVIVPGVEPPSVPPWQARAKNIYPTLEAALTRFRLIPDQNRAEPYIIDYIARHSVKEVPGGWTWKFDETFRAQFEPDGDQLLGQIALPLTIIHGDRSEVMSMERAAAIMKCVRGGRSPIVIPDCHHHVMLDQPLALIAALRAELGLTGHASLPPP
jgi:pimeloyl-ACP methyl ester carboxylesterase